MLKNNTITNKTKRQSTRAVDGFAVAVAGNRTMVVSDKKDEVVRINVSEEGSFLSQVEESTQRNNFDADSQKYLFDESLGQNLDLVQTLNPNPNPNPNPSSVNSKEIKKVEDKKFDKSDFGHHTRGAIRSFDYSQYNYEDTAVSNTVKEGEDFQINANRQVSLINKSPELDYSKETEELLLDADIGSASYNGNITQKHCDLKGKLADDADEKLAKFLHHEKQAISSKQQEQQGTGSAKDIQKNNKTEVAVASGNKKKLLMAPFIAGAVAVSVVVIVISFIAVSFRAKDNIEVMGVRAVSYIKEAKVNLQNKDFKLATTNLVLAKQEFQDAQKQVDKIGGDSLDVFSQVPVLSKISSGKNIIALGDNLTEAVVQLSKMSELLSGVGNPLDFDNKDRSSLTVIFLKAQESIKLAQDNLQKAELASEKINVEDLPKEYQEKVKFIKDFLPVVNNSLDEFDRLSKIFLELFGHYGNKKYLVLFQNNQEMRATGGFIGSYGLLETSHGKISKLKIDDIYNPDGQLRVDVVPPRPIQKISAGWTTHDANWWPDFPKSAEKISWFYEKTGGATVDGIIAVTPVLLQKMLEVTGPIEMSEYAKVVTSGNFIKEIQQEVEVDYADGDDEGEGQVNKKESIEDGDDNDTKQSTGKKIDEKTAENIKEDSDKEQKQPKKILGDLAPKIFARFFDLDNPKQAGLIIKVLLESLQEKHVLINFKNKEIQEIVSQQGWSGEVLKTDKDYLMVVNSNINGYKTDGVIKESIEHQAEIDSDGTVIDTVTITRKHEGGNTSYEWWNKVNADYMRVYVPKGSRLISASGHTREVNTGILNYDKLGFEIDPEVQAEEKQIRIDAKSGTKIYTDSGKTVFANWVYVSPQEQVTVVYKYLLPFKVNTNKDSSGRYSLLTQKQSGSVNSEIEAEIEFPFEWNASWVEPKNLKFDKRDNRLIFKHNLNMDQFVGVVFSRQLE